MMQQQISEIYKIILVGDAGVGKTHILYSFSKDKVPTNIMPTIALEYTSKLVEIQNKVVRAQIWDTSGQEQYRALTMNHYRRAIGALVIFDVTSRRSFDHVQEWLSAVLDKAEANVQIGLVGHKVDQLRREVSREEGQQLASKSNLFYVQTTVKDPFTIRNAFRRLLGTVSQAKKNEVVGIKLNEQEILRDNESACLC